MGTKQVNRVRNYSITPQAIEARGECPDEQAARSVGAQPG